MKLMMSSRWCGMERRGEESRGEQRRGEERRGEEKVGGGGRRR